MSSPTITSESFSPSQPSLPRVLRRFMSEFTATELLAQAMKEGISLMNIEPALAALVPEAENPIDLLQKLEKVSFI